MRYTLPVACTVTLLLGQVAYGHTKDGPLSRLQGVAGADHRSAQASGASQSFSAVQDLIKRAQTGGEAGIVADMFASKDLDVLFAKPEIVGILLQEMPFLKSFNAVKPFYDKGADLTPNDGLTVLSHLRSFATESLKNSADLVGEDAGANVAKNMKKYANSPDPAVRELVKQVGLGDSQANLKLQQHIADDFFGKQVDLGALGLNGVEPDAFKSLRTRFLGNSLFAAILDGLPSAAKDAIFEPFNVAKKSVEALSKTA